MSGGPHTSRPMPRAARAPTSRGGGHTGGGREWRRTAHGRRAGAGAGARRRPVVACGDRTTPRKAGAAPAAALALALAAQPAWAALEEAPPPPLPPPAVEQTVNAQPRASPTSDAAVLVDRSNVLSPRQRASLDKSIRELEADTGWRLRVWAADGIFLGRDSTIVEDAQKYFTKGKDLVMLLFDPSSPNAIQVVLGAEAGAAKLKGDFLPELRGRFGNLFYIRDHGADGALVDAADVLLACLRSDAPCEQVPGLDQDQYAVTLTFSVFAGIIAGLNAAVGRGNPLPTVPLWGPMLVAYGIIPLLQRDVGAGPVAANLGAFFALALLIYAAGARGMFNKRGREES